MSTSNLPSAAEIRNEIRLRIEQVVVQRHPSSFELVAFDRVIEGVPQATYTHVYKIEDPRIDGQLPSKAFFTEDGLLVLTFYCSSSLPNRARPFAGGPVYVMWFDAQFDETFEYDGEVRLFIDQIANPNGRLTYVVMFGQDQYSSVVIPSPKADPVPEWSWDMEAE
jgi:hypothetical protein